MEEKLATVLEQLGSDGIEAFYVYLAFDYVSLWVFVGLCVWGARTVWNKRKDGI